MVAWWTPVIVGIVGALSTAYFVLCWLDAKVSGGRWEDMATELRHESDRWERIARGDR